MISDDLVYHLISATKSFLSPTYWKTLHICSRMLTNELEAVCKVAFSLNRNDEKENEMYIMPQNKMYDFYLLHNFNNCTYSSIIIINIIVIIIITVAVFSS